MKQLKEELKRLGLPIYGSKGALLELCRVHGVRWSAGFQSAPSTIVPATQVLGSGFENGPMEVLDVIRGDAGGVIGG